MANIKVSDMNEITEPENLADTYVYTETEKTTGNTYGKMSLETIKDNVNGPGTIENPTPFGVFFDTTSPIKLTKKTFVLPIDCFIVATDVRRETIGALKVADSVEEERTTVLTRRYGGYFHAGQVIEIGDEDYYIFPLENGNVDTS